MYVTVEENAKIGNFSIDFEDLTTNSLQTPITLTRIYDRRDRHVSGDFGYGWSQAVKNIRIYMIGEKASYSIQQSLILLLWTEEMEKQISLL